MKCTHLRQIINYVFTLSLATLIRGRICLHATQYVQVGEGAGQVRRILSTVDIHIQRLMAVHCWHSVSLEFL